VEGEVRLDERLNMVKVGGQEYSHY